MDGVLEVATLLCICKLACSLPFVSSRSLSSLSPVSFCCCCLLLFTDLVLTVFFSVFCILERWQIELTSTPSTPSTGDVIALRALLFISHTYGAVFLLTLPVITIDTFIWLLQQKTTFTSPDTIQVKKSKNVDKNPVPYIVGYLCCLSVWIYGTLSIRWRWKLEEVWSAACLHSADSLLTCLPNMLSPMLRLLAPYWALVLLYFMFVIILAIDKFTRQACTRNTSPSSLLINHKASFKSVDKATSGEVQLSKCVNGDLGLVSHGCSKGEEIGQEDDRTETAIPLTFITERPMVPKCKSQWVFSSPGTNHVMIGFVCTLALFVLPLNLSVNIHLISSVDRLLKLSLKYLVLSKSVMSYKNMDMI